VRFVAEHVKGSDLTIDVEKSGPDFRRASEARKGARHRSDCGRGSVGDTALLYRPVNRTDSITRHIVPRGQEGGQNSLEMAENARNRCGGTCVARYDGNNDASEMFVRSSRSLK
jgi:hypothetical protein